MREIPEDNLAYPVLIKLGDASLGSAFQLNTGKELFLITAKHVLFNKNGTIKGQSAEITCPSRDIHDDSQEVLGLDLAALQKEKHIRLSKTHDVCAIKLGNVVGEKKAKGYVIQYLPSVRVIHSTTSGLVAVRLENCTKLEGVLISNDVYLYGYPSSLGMRNSPQFDASQPLLRKGIVAGLNKKQQTIILDCPVYYGNSGGPVVQVTKHNGHTHHSVIGLVSQFIPFMEQWKNHRSGMVNTEMSNSGYSVIVAMDAVIALLGIV